MADWDSMCAQLSTTSQDTKDSYHQHSKQRPTSPARNTVKMANGYFPAPGKIPHKPAQSQADQRLADLYFLRQTLLDIHCTRQDTRIATRRSQLAHDRATTQRRLDLLVRMLGPQILLTRTGRSLAPRIDLASAGPDYISLLLETGRMPVPSRRLAEHMAWRAHEASMARAVSGPNFVNHRLSRAIREDPRLAALYKEPIPWAVPPVQRGQLPRETMLGEWEMRAFEAAEECERFGEEMSREYLSDPEVQAVEREILRLETEIGKRELERKDSPLEGIAGSVAIPICMDLDIDAVSTSLFGGPTGQRGEL